VKILKSVSFVLQIKKMLDFRKSKKHGYGYMKWYTSSSAETDYERQRILKKCLSTPRGLFIQRQTHPIQNRKLHNILPIVTASCLIIMRTVLCRPYGNWNIPQSQSLSADVHLSRHLLSSLSSDCFTVDAIRKVIACVTFCLFSRQVNKSKF
jgi:hypothetical protein